MNSIVTKLVTLIVLCGMAMSVVAGLRSPREMKWSEEVLLGDGKVIVVEREMIYERGGNEWASNRGGYKPKKYRLRFANPAGTDELIEWKTSKEFGTWPEVPLVLDVVAGQLTIFSLVAISNGCEVYSKYVYQQGAWVEKVLPDRFEPIRTNLLFGIGDELPRIVRMSDKERRNAGTGYRRSLKHAGPERKVCS
jgi:hypothetical protein